MVVGLFTTETNWTQQLTLLDSEAVNQPAFDGVDRLLQASKLTLAGAAAVPRASSSAIAPESGRREPSLTLFLTRDSFVTSGVTEDNGNWDGRWDLTSAVRAEWNTWCSGSVDPVDYASRDLFVFVANAHAIRRIRLLYKSKPALQSVLHRVLGGGASVYLSSTPAVYVVFSTAASLARAHDARRIDALRDGLNTTLQQRDEWQCFVPGDVAIEFLDAETSSSIMGGIARED